ncbi:hypothetical protein QCA50_018276 [Cerrena zonata]|uniref:F-box domain-containing protein n=1 Tax=Cerrena zonata TaxID=2478898 RepID=A0AAW0FI98_9APHY
MPKAGPSTRKKPRNIRSSVPTRQQPARACKRSAGDIDPSSSHPSKRIRTEAVTDKTKDTVRPKRKIPPKRDTSGDTSRNKRQHQPVIKSKSKSKRKHSALESDAGDDDSLPQADNTKSTIKRRRLDQKLVDKAPTPTPTPTPNHKPPSWHLPPELFYLIYDYLWDNENMECYATRTLRSCALTCSWWRDAVRPYIFRFITLDGPEDFDKFSQQIRATPEITQWVRKLRLEGRSLPWIDDTRLHREDAGDDIDQWLYVFPTVLDAHFPCLKILELFNFSQISPRREDREAYARWIPKLTTLTSVTTLNILRCEMSANNLTALVRALPGLTRVDLVEIDITHPNFAVLHDGPIDPAAEATGAGDQPTKYPLFYPPPILQSFRLDNSDTYYLGFDFTLVREWFRAESLAEHLKSFEVYGNVDLDSLRDVVFALGESPKLSHLQLPVGPDAYGIECEYEMSELGFDLSRLTNLTSIRIVGCDGEWGHEDQVSTIRGFLDQLNAPKLRMIALTIFLEKEEDIAMIAPIDQSLVDSKFSKLEDVQIELTPTRLRGYEPDIYIQKVRRQFPLTDERGILTVINHGWYRYYLKHSIGIRTRTL